MLTTKKLGTWRAHRGDTAFADKFLRAERDGISYDEWMLITELTQRLRLIRQGKTSEAFQAKTEELIRNSTADAETRDQLRELSEEFL
jgi:hypothetical protein